METNYDAGDELLMQVERLRKTILLLRDDVIGGNPDLAEELHDCDIGIRRALAVGIKAIAYKTGVFVA